MLQIKLGIDQILEEAVAIAAPAAREAFVAQACGDDLPLRQRVERLIANHFNAGSFLDCTANPCVPTIPLADPQLIGASIGPYKLLELIGEGGMGLVYMAEQQRPIRRLVALKIIKPGMDSRQISARFEAERQALAMMDHPNIAKVLDAGTADSGQPYFVMELVRGLPIAEFCDHKRLSVRERLELFIQICQAVQHAHQKGIIHRDLKPTNVLVTMHDATPVPKIIDFGIAKALGQSLTEHTLHTGFAQLVGTPLYMSPEQAEMNALGVDTRSDIYSLGVMLYELLTGTTPFDKERLKSAGFDEMRRIIREEEPETVSKRMSRTLSRRDRAALPGVDARAKHSAFHTSQLRELDWITARCLEKDRVRRYESASALAADVERYLADEAVQACPPSRIYHWRKLLKKNRLVVASSVGVAVALIVGTALATWQAIEANAARKLADERLVLAGQRLKNEQQARKDVEAQRNLANAQRMRAVAGEQAAAAQERATIRTNRFLMELIEARFQEDPAGEADFRMSLAKAQLDGGDPHPAILNFKRAEVLRRSYLGPDDLETIECTRLLAEAHRAAGLLNEALPLYEQVLKSFTAKLGRNNHTVASLLHVYARTHQRAGHLEEADRLYRAALDILDQIGERSVDTRSAMARNLLLMHRYVEAEGYARAAVESPLNQKASATRFAAMTMLGWSLLGQKRFAEAEPLLLEAYRGLKEAESSQMNDVFAFRIAEVAQRLVELYEATGQEEQYRSWKAILQNAAHRLQTYESKYTPQTQSPSFSQPD